MSRESPSRLIPMRSSLLLAPVLSLSIAALAGGCTGEISGGGDAGPELGLDGGIDASSPDAAVPPPFDWVGIIGTGQSLAVGATAELINTTQPFGNLKLIDNGPDPKYPLEPGEGAPEWAAVPLVEPIREEVAGEGPGYDDKQYPNNIRGETPHSGMANTLSLLWEERGGPGDYVTAHSAVGWGGRCLAYIDKEGGPYRPYLASLAEARVFADLAAAAGKTFGYGGIILTHGECDGKRTPGYGEGLYQLWLDYNADLKAITGQTSDIPLFASQQSTRGAGSPDSSAIQLWQAGVEHPGQIICTGPKYQYKYSSDNLHLPGPAYEALGEKYAEVFDLVVNQKVDWKPLQPERITRSGAVLTIDFHVPNPPLVWDQHISPPHQDTNVEWSKGRGFEVEDADGNHLTIAGVTIHDSSVILTLSEPPPPGTLYVAYAYTQFDPDEQGGTDLGMRGQLRDSDDFKGYSAQTLEVNVTNGATEVTSDTPSAFAHRAVRDLVTGADLPDDTIITATDGDTQLTLSAPWSGPTGKATLTFQHDHRNYCVHFRMPVP